MALPGMILVRTGRAAGALALGAGVVFDLIQPVVGLGWWSVALCAAVAIVAGCSWILKERPALRTQLSDGRIGEAEYAHAEAQSRSLTAMVGSLVALPLLTAVTLVSARHPNQGFLAATIPAVERLQGSLLRIERTVTQVAKNTAALTSQVAGLDAKMEVGFVSLQEALARAGDNPITNPRTPQDFLLNARIFASVGNYLKAKESYRRFFAYDMEYIEPHLDYQALLKNTDGLLVAQEEYRTRASDGRAFSRFLSIMLEESLPRRYSELVALRRTTPNFGPALVELLAMEPARLDRLGNQGGVMGVCALLRRWQRLLAALDTTMARGNYLRYYLDKRGSEDRARQVAHPVNGYRWLADDTAQGYCAMADSVRRGLHVLQSSAKEDSIARLILDPPGP